MPAHICMRMKNGLLGLMRPCFEMIKHMNTVEKNKQTCSTMSLGMESIIETEKGREIVLQTVSFCQRTVPE